MNYKYLKDTYKFKYIMTTLISGREISKIINEELKQEIRLLEHYRIIPGLAVILVGDRKDSQTYVNMKRKRCRELGIKSVLIKLESDVSQDEIIDNIIELNNDNSIHGILIQLPLPKGIDEERVLSTVKLEKDVDGFHFENMGRLVKNRNPLFTPCTPEGCVELLNRYNIEISGKDVVVLGRSNIVGLPIALLLLHRNATVTICHSRTTDIEDKVRRADILIAACGRTQMVKKDWLKKGVVIIDVGINSIDDPSRKRGYRLVGDVDFDNAKEVASYITPVPGGVGPMTISMLMKHTVQAASRYACQSLE